METIIKNIRVSHLKSIAMVMVI